MPDEPVDSFTDGRSGLAYSMMVITVYERLVILDVYGMNPTAD